MPPTFKDLDGDGTPGQGEPFISWTYTQTVNGGVQTVQSPAGGWYTTTLIEGDTWTVSEHARFNWTPTTASSQSGTAACADVQVLFGNTYTGFDIVLPLVVRELAKKGPGQGRLPWPGLGFFG